MTLRTCDLSDPGTVRAGAALGSDHIGVNVWELPPGQVVCPYHWESHEEEFAMALDGPMWVRTAEGVERVEPMLMVRFPRGPEGVHQIRNDGEGTVRVLMFGEISDPGASVYPDEGQASFWSRWPEAGGRFDLSSRLT